MPTNLLAGVLLTIAAGIGFASMDAVGKQLTTLTSVLMVVWGRYAVQTVIMSVVLARSTGTAFLKPRRPFLQTARGLALLGATGLMYTSLAHVPLADATAAVFVQPVIVTILSVIFLGERIGIHRIGAILFGFVGVLLVVRPGSAGMNPAILLAVAAAFSNAIYLLLTRQLAGADDAAATQFNTTAVGAFVLTVAVALNWETPSAETAVLMVAAGSIGTIGHFCLVRAFAHAPASLLSPFLYVQVLFAGVLSVAVFGDPIHPAMLAGTVILVLSGLYIWWREIRTG